MEHTAVGREHDVLGGKDKLVAAVVSVLEE
jgi:hypothetical protein